MSEEGGCSAGTDTTKLKHNGENDSGLQLQQEHRAKLTTLGSNCHKAAVRQSDMTSQTLTTSSLYLVEQELSVTRDTIMLQYHDTCQLMYEINE